MKTTYIITQTEVNTFKLPIRIYEEKIIDYFFNRQKMKRWYKEINDIKKKNSFYEHNGIIDISFEQIFKIDEFEAKKKITKNNVEYLVNRSLINNYNFNNIDCKIYRVIAENVKNAEKIFEEIHLIIDKKNEDPVPFRYLDLFYGNIYDYIKQKEVLNK